MSKREKTPYEKMKNLFARRDTTPINFESLRVEPFVVSIETLRDIGPENTVGSRLKVLKDLYEHILTKKLAENAVESICKEIEDLLNLNQSMETRHTVFQFYCALINGQQYHMNIMRSYLFKLVVCHSVQEDLMPRLEMLKALSDNGRTISNFEEEVGPFLLNWFPEVMKIEKSAEFLSLVKNVIKFNAAYLDDNIIQGFIHYILKLVCRTKFEEDIQESLNILEAILCYSHLPSCVLHSFACILCCTVNMDKFSHCSWKQMRNLLGTNIGHTGIYTLCLLLQDKNYYLNSKLIRGAVLFISMSLWGRNRVSTLSHPPTAILPSFLKVMESNDIFVIHEVITALHLLVTERADLLVNRDLIWDSIFDIVERVIYIMESESSNTSTAVLAKDVHKFITFAEEQCPEESFYSLFKIIEDCADSRSEQSVKRLITYKAEQIKWYKPDFLFNLNHLLEKFFKNEKRSAVQLEVLKFVRNIRETSARFFEDDMTDQTILQNISHSETIADVSVRKAAVELLVIMAESSKNSWFIDILEVIGKIMKHLFENISEPPLEDESHSDVIAAVEGLIHVFKKKLFYIPSNQCTEIFDLLVDHLQQHYQTLNYFEDIIKIRKLILEFFFQLRSNRYKQVGILTPNQTEYSVYVLCDTGTQETTDSSPSSPPPGSPSSLTPVVSYLNYEKAYQVIITCIKEEKDWPILEMVYKELPLMLQNKALIINGNCSVSPLCVTLYTLINDRNNGLPGSLKNAPARLTRTDVQGHIFPCVAALTSYHSNLESYMQRLIIKCLQSGLVSRSAKVCMEGLTLCSLEMQNSMIKLLPDVLLKLSKISATKIVAVSVLEFLSNIIRLPHLYVSFVEDQYMSIFAIALPYTNPFKFNQYTVALAHHVLSMWFLKCRIPFRRDFAKFITKGLRSNLNVPIEENQNLSSRSEEEAKSGELTTAAIVALHTELMETGLDLMARFTFGMCTNVPQRSPVAEFLLEKGQKTSWLVGNKIVTITTSGCGTKSFKQGLCEQCYTSTHEMSQSSESENESIFMENEEGIELGPEKFSAQRKRHRSAIQRTNSLFSKEALTTTKQAKDDITLHFQRMQGFSSARRHTSFHPDIDAPEERLESSAKAKEKEDCCQLCSCWCTSWAEIYIRRPTGNTSWMMKLNNQVFLPSSPLDVPLSVLNSLILPQIQKEDQMSCEICSLESEGVVVSEPEFKALSSAAIDITPSVKMMPMRRTNSSPDMNTGWLLEREIKQSALEDSAESNKDSLEHEVFSSSELSTSTDQELSEKGKLKNLKLDLTAAGKNLNPEHPSCLNSAPLERRIYSQDVQQTSASTSFRDRGHTISVMSPNRPTGADNVSKRPEVSQRSGMSPSFVFLQLFHNSSFGPATYKQLLLQQTEINSRALSVLDHIPPYDTHKIGVVYVGPDQADDEVAILSNVYGSTRYVNLLRGLGNIIELTDIDPHTTYLGGLDTRGEDGLFGLIWHDDVMQVVFHVATFMLNKDSDKMRNEKKKHIANDSVMIVYNESGQDFKLSTIKGHVTNACVIVKPDDFNCNIVTVKHKTKELTNTFGHTESYIVSDESLPVLVRQMALHANLASLIISRRQHSAKYAQVSNWLERLRAIKRLRSKVMEELKTKNENFGFEASDAADYNDFTDYV